jgi:hypothetical protein
MSVSTSSVPPGDTDGRTGDAPALAVELQVDVQYTQTFVNARVYMSSGVC